MTSGNTQETPTRGTAALRQAYIKAGVFGAFGLAVFGFASQAGAQTVEAVQIGAFEKPVFIASAPGAKKYLFIVEQGGKVRILKNEVPFKRPFLNIRDLVYGQPYDKEAGGEQGLLSIAFAPDYETTGLFYVAYTSRKGDLRVEEFKRSVDKARLADPSSRRRLLKVRHRDAQNHNGGQLHFGKDGHLYISTGDGGGAGDPEDNARKKGKLNGKLLRINPKPGKNKPYRIPKSNPFKGTTGLNEIYAYGLRNPWRFSFHGNKIFIADVGQRRWEEVNALRTADVAGANFGWPQYEGHAIFDNDRPGADPVTFPQLVYHHDNGGCSVTGGYVVTDPALPDLAGRYVYADYCLGDIRSFIPRKPAKDDSSTGVALPFPTSFGVGAKGQLYVAQANGAVSRLVPAAPDAAK